MANPSQEHVETQDVLHINEWNSASLFERTNVRFAWDAVRDASSRARLRTLWISMQCEPWSLELMANALVVTRAPLENLRIDFRVIDLHAATRLENIFRAQTTLRDVTLNFLPPNEGAQVKAASLLYGLAESTSLRALRLDFCCEAKKYLDDDDDDDDDEDDSIQLRRDRAVYENAFSRMARRVTTRRDVPLDVLTLKNTRLTDVTTRALSGTLDSVVTLKVVNCRLDAAATEFLLRPCVSFSRLVTLNLAYNSVCMESADARHALAALVCGALYLCEINLAHVDLRDDRIEEIAAALAVTQAPLTTLVMSHCKLRDAWKIVAALRRLTTLRHVDLASNEFGDDAIELVARACVHYVRDLCVNENPFSHVGGRALLDAVRASTTIRRLYARHRTSHSTPCVSLKLEWLAMLRRGDAWPLDDCETSLVARTIGIDAWRLVARASFGNRSLYMLDLNRFPNEHAIDQALNTLFNVRCMKYLV